MLQYFLSVVFQILSVSVCVILATAYLTYAERKVIASIQLRKGPELVGPLGLLQPIADAMKLMFKELIIPRNANKFIFLFAPCLVFVLAIIGWAVMPFGGDVDDNGVFFSNAIADINVGVLYLLAVSSMSVYGIIMAGWSSNSNYSFLGALRSASQMISYEVCMGLVVACIILLSGTMNLGKIVFVKHSMPYWVDLMLFPLCIVFFISILAETNRHPFDLPEAESELVSGYNVEYSATPFALFFLGEYANMILTSAMLVIFFMGGWYPVLEFDFLYKIPGLFWFVVKVVFVLFWFIVVRAALPRYRYDQLMTICWKFLMPICFLWLIIIGYLVAYGKV